MRVLANLRDEIARGLRHTALQKTDEHSHRGAASAGAPGERWANSLSAGRHGECVGRHEAGAGRPSSRDGPPDAARLGGSGSTPRASRACGIGPKSGRPAWLDDGQGGNAEGADATVPAVLFTLNAIERVWLYLRERFPSHRLWPSYDDILDACYQAWNAPLAEADRIRRSLHPLG